MKIKTLLTLFLGIISIQLSNAHALWIETSNEGKLNQNHIVKVYYGEYAEQVVDPIEKWYSNVKDFEILLISPSGTKTKLEKKATTDYYESEFNPTENGIYTISIIHPALEPYETMRFEFSSIAFVNIGRQKLTEPSLPFHLKANNTNPKVGSELEISVLNQGEIQKNIEVIVMGPEGWTKTLTSDINGIVKFKPLISGKYVIEASKTDDKKENWNGKDIEKIWRGTTLSIFVK